MRSALSGIRKLTSNFGSSNLKSVGAINEGHWKDGKEFFLSYPLKRAVNEDSFLIQSVRYKPPGKGIGLPEDWMKNSEKMTSIMQKDGPETETEKTKTVEKINIEELAKNTTGQEAHDRYGTHSPKRYTGGQDTDTNFYVELPIPKQVNDGNAVTWNANSMNMFTLAGLDLASGLMSAPGRTLNEAQGILNEMVANTNFESIGTTRETVQNTIRASIAGAAINQFGANVTPNTVMSRALGKILNSNKELLFDGVTLREFKFDFTFTPRSIDEGIRARKIISRLKKSMAPKSGRSESVKQGLYLSSPDLFLLRYLSGGEDHPFLNSFKACALTNLSVNYTGGGTYSTYGDSTPVHMKVSMVFKETNPIYDEDYDDVSAGVGF